MNWLTKLTPPGVKNIFTKRDTPDDLWMRCPKSGEMVFSSDLPGLFHVTPAGHHMRIGPELRLDYTFGKGMWEELPLPEVPRDPLKRPGGRRCGDFHEGEVRQAARAALLEQRRIRAPDAPREVRRLAPRTRLAEEFRAPLHLAAIDRWHFRGGRAFPRAVGKHVQPRDRQLLHQGQRGR